jgi:Flp pilus assembly protein TadG
MRDLIFRGFRRLRTRHPWMLARPGEQGAIGVLVAVLVAGGVLFGMGALVIDVGQLYQNRAELQNGADAGALAVAKSCVAGLCTPTIASTYANANASKLTGGTADVNLVCGSGIQGACPASTGKITDCPAAPPSGTNYVDVHTSTELPGGSHLLPPVFARTLAGNGNYQGTTVYACAQAEWGAPSTATTVAYTISACTWDKYTNQGQTLAPPPPYSPPYSSLTSVDSVVYEHGSTNNTICPAQYQEPSGSDGPGNFGWTSDTGTCSVTITNNTYPGSTGASANSDCLTALYNAWSTQSTIYLPVYTTATGSGNNLLYTLKGFAAFVVTGYYFPGSAGQQAKEKDWVTGNYPCSGSNFCLSGFFTHGLISSVGALGGPNLGAYIVKLTG